MMQASRHAFARSFKQTRHQRISLNLIERLSATSVRWFIVYSALSALAFAVLLSLIGYSVMQSMESEADSGLRWHLRYFDTYADADLASLIENRIQHDPRHTNFYGLFNPAGGRLAGNLESIPRGLSFDRAGFSHRRLRGMQIPFRWDGSESGLRVMGEIRDDGTRLVVGRTTDDIARVRDQLLRASIGCGVLCLLLSMVAGLVLSLRQMRRVFEIQRVTHKIANGDLALRLPVSGSDELATLSRLVNQMLDDVERLMGEVKSACDVVAHDLRTPLAQLKMRLSSMLDACQKGQTQGIEASLSVARDETDNLLNRFSAMLRISEIGVMQRRSGFAALPLSGLVGELCELYAPLAEARHIRFSVRQGGDGAIRADRALLFEAFSNLLDNALKFTPSGGHVLVELRQVAAGLRFSVSDSGPGIPPEEREKVLTRFYRSARTRHLPGTGLGLGIVMAIARLHEFALLVEESEYGGACLVVECWPHQSSFTTHR